MSSARANTSPLPPFGGHSVECPGGSTAPSGRGLLPALKEFGHPESAYHSRMRMLLCTALLTLAPSALGLTFKTPASLLVGQPIALSSVTDTPRATITSSHPDVIEVSGNQLLIKRLTPAGVNVTLTARAGNQSATQSVTTHGAEFNLGRGLVMPGSNQPGIHPYVVVRARSADGKAPDGLGMAVGFKGGTPGQMRQVPGSRAGSMYTFITLLPQNQGPYTVDVAVNGQTTRVAFEDARLPTPTASLRSGLTGKISGQNVSLSGKVPNQGRLISVRFFDSRDFPVWEVWSNVYKLPFALPFKDAPDSAKKVDIRLFSAPLLDDRAVLPQTSTFVQYRIGTTK